MIKVKFFVGDDSALNTLQKEIEGWQAGRGIVPVNMNSSVHYDDGWHIIVTVYYQEGPMANIIVPTMTALRVD